MTRIKADQEEASQHARRLLEDCLKTDGNLLLICHSKDEIGCMMSGTTMDIVSLVGNLAEKEPAMFDLVVKMFVYITSFQVEKMHGPEKMQEFNQYLHKILTPPPSPKADC